MKGDTHGVMLLSLKKEKREEKKNVKNIEREIEFDQH